MVGILRDEPKFNVATPPVLSYHSRDSIVGTSQEQETVLKISIFEAVVLSCLRFLFSGRDGVFRRDGGLDLRIEETTV